MTSSLERVTVHHRQQHAYVYVRQSTAKQVQQHQESRDKQYTLVERAIGLGWPPERVHVIDADLGQPGQDDQRPGFQELVAAVSLGRVGLILAYEASRLARNYADWYALLDLAALRGALIGDTEGVYDPRVASDRLLLGMRGLLREAELHLLHLRIDAGRQRQMERGTYRQHRVSASRPFDGRRGPTRLGVERNVRVCPHHDQMPRGRGSRASRKEWPSRLAPVTGRLIPRTGHAGTRQAMNRYSRPSAIRLPRT